MKSSRWEPDPRKFLSRQEVHRLHTFAENNTRSNHSVDVRNGFLIRLGLATGLRVMEIAALQCGELNLEYKVPFLVVSKGKGKKKRRVYFNASFRDCCDEYLMYKQSSGESTDPDQPLFKSSMTGGHLTTRAIQKVFKKCAQKSGLSPHYSIHCLRHTYACFLLKASNWNLRLVQKQLGHSKITTTQVYADVMISEIKKAVDKMYK